MLAVSEKGFYNVLVLAVAQIFAFTAVPMLMFIGSLIGAELAPSVELATLPIAAMVVGTAVATIPVALLMQRFGRKRIFLLAVLLAALACLGINLALALQHFFLYCGFIFVIGTSLAAMQHFRFAAMESVATDKMPTAAAYILIGGVVAAFLGPELAVLGQSFTTIDYQGSFYLAMCCYLMCAVTLMFYRSKATVDVQRIATNTRPLSLILNSRTLWLAVASAAIGYALMSFIMTATPISMHHMHHHGLTETKWVIQSHIAFMFLPSLLTPILIPLIGLRGMIALGLAAYALCIAIAYSSTALWAFWSALILLGVGWNFLFVAGTSMLPSTYNDGEQFKVQAFNEAVVFSLQAVAALSAGWVLKSTGWGVLLLACLPLMGLLLFILWYTRPCSSRAG